MTLAEQIKHADERAAALRRELEMEQAFGFANVVARHAAADAALTAARVAFAEAEKAWHDWCVTPADGRIGAPTFEERQARGHALHNGAHACRAAIREALNDREATLKEVQAAASAVHRITRRMEIEVSETRAMPKAP